MDLSILILILVVLFELFLVSFICWGILHENKLIHFERRLTVRFLNWLNRKMRSYQEVD